MDDALPDILDKCLVHLADGATVDECLATYPAWRAALEQPLRVAARLRALPSTALPAVVRVRLEAQLLMLAAARPATLPATPRPSAPRARRLDAILAGVLCALSYRGPLCRPWQRLVAPLSRWRWR